MLTSGNSLRSFKIINQNSIDLKKIKIHGHQQTT